MNFLQFLLNDISLPVIMGMFTYRLLSSFINDIIMPIIMTFFPSDVFHNYDIVLGEDNEIILSEPVDLKNSVKNHIGTGIFLREFVVWISVMIIFYMIFYITQK